MINVTTITKPMKQEDTPTDQPIFPAPPNHPRNVEFNLSRQVMIRTHSWTEYGNNTVAVLGGFSPSAPANQPNWYDQVQVETTENVWLPDLGDEKKNRGSWKQQITFRSNFTLTCPPTFSSNTMSILVRLLHCRDCLNF